MGIALVLPGVDFVDQGLLVWDAAVEALGGEDAEFGFGEIEPTAMLWRVVPFESLDQPSCFGRREGLVERGLAVDIEIVLDEHDGLGVREVDIGQFLEDVRIVDGGVAGGSLDSGPRFEWGER